MILQPVRFFFIVVACLFSLGRVAVAKADDGPVLSVRISPEYVDLRLQIQTLINIYGFQKTNYFCVILYAPESKDDEPPPIIYWPTQDKLIVWGIGSDMLFSSDRYINLSHNILPDGQWNASPDYETVSSAHSIIRDCERRGYSFAVNKTQGGWVSIGKFHQFSSVRAQLQDLVNRDATNKQNRFCIIGQKDGSFLGAYVIWLTEDELFFWLPSQYDQSETDVLSDSTLNINLREGLRDKEDAKDDRNEMQKSYAGSILRACSRTGQYFDVLKTN